MIKNGLQKIVNKCFSEAVLLSEISFPLNFEELNQVEKKFYRAAIEFKTDHPGYKDQSYLERRKAITEISNSYKLGQKIPVVNYTDKEHELWKFLYDNLHSQHLKYACDQYLFYKEKVRKEGILTRDKIPQMETLNNYLNEENNWYLRPCEGWLSPREFLNGLAFRVFYCSQYIRHTSNPFFSPEPDILHEYVGHFPQFASKRICDLNQLMGICSLGASEEDIKILSALYWYTMEFGLCKEGGNRKIVGAGILGCYDDADWCMSGKPEVRPFNIEEISKTYDYELVDLQKKYFLAESYDDWISQVEEYLKKMRRKVKIMSNSKGCNIQYAKL